MGEIRAISGGEALEKRLAEISAELGKKASLQVGFMMGGTPGVSNPDGDSGSYPDGTPVAMVAAIQEFGAPAASIPPRPFMRPTVAKHASEWGDRLAGALKHFDYDTDKALTAMGGEIIGPEIQEAIIAVDAPPLSPITIMLRKMKSDDQSLVVTGKTVAEAAQRVIENWPTDGVNTKPLDDTAHLLRSVTFKVGE